MVLASCELMASMAQPVEALAPAKTFFQFLPPTETLLRTQLSPVPAHTTLGFVGSIATAPIDCTAALSKTGLKLVPPFTDFQTPPLAEPTNTMSRPSLLIAVTAATRPLMAAEPMLRAGRPEMAPAS